MTNLKSCPHCGAPAVVIPLTLNIAAPHRPRTGVTVMCTKMCTETTPRATEAEAATAWNRRASWSWRAVIAGWLRKLSGAA